MALLSFAGSPHGGRQKLLPEWRSQPRMTPTAIIDHSIVGSALGAFYYFRDRSGNEAHFIVDLDGRIWQLVDTGHRADANLAANGEAISIETADNGDPDHFPWTRAQLDSLVWLHDKLARVHPTIPRRKCTRPWTAPRGLGYHCLPGLNTRAHPTTNPWTSAIGKTCPGRPARVDQWNRILLPAFLHPEDDMSAADVHAINAHIDRKLGFTPRDGIYGVLQDMTHGRPPRHSLDTLHGDIALLLHGAEGHPNSLDSLSAKVDALTAKLDALASVVEEIGKVVLPPEPPPPPPPPPPPEG